MGVDRGITKIGIDPIDQSLGGGVLHVFGFFMDLRSTSSRNNFFNVCALSEFPTTTIFPS